ncbi:MAG: ATP-binding protein [Candidatus Cloacimonetes bacterium]|jgi:signal transduction histidine kinase|nr:ATP-binding protein [Candidatus Cloacimonadota bacterium]
MISEKKLKAILILLAAIIICGWLALLYIQIMNTAQQLTQKKLHNLAYLDILKRAISNNIIAGETIEKTFMAKLELAAKILQNQTGISNQQLQKLCLEHDLWELSFIDLTGNVINSNLYRGIYPHDLSLLELQRGETTVLSLPADPGQVFGSRILVKKRENLYFVGAVSDSVLKRYTKDISLASMIDFVEGSLVEGSEQQPEAGHTLYVVVQDTFGILTATSNITSLKRIEDDEFLKKIYQSQQSDSRFTVFGERTILETVAPFRLNGYDFGVIRLGVSLQRFNRARVNQRLVLLLFSLIFLSSLFLEYLFYRNYKKLQYSRDELNTHRRMVEIARLGGEVAHEIKNPLNSIFMILQRLRIEFEAKERDEEFKSLLKISYSEIERLNRIVEQFLSISRKLEIKRQSADVNRIISSVVDLFNNNTEGVVIKFEAPKELKFSLDEKLLKQVLINLIKNAMEAFDQTNKQQEIVVTSKKIKHNLMISIWDNGCGITTINLSRIWDLYFTTKQDGNGIGLAVCKKIIEGHGGHISVQSMPRKGTKFRIVLPADQE